MGHKVSIEEVWGDVDYVVDYPQRTSFYVFQSLNILVNGFWMIALIVSKKRSVFGRRFQAQNKLMFMLFSNLFGASFSVGFFGFLGEASNNNNVMCYWMKMISSCCFGTAVVCKYLVLYLKSKSVEFQRSKLLNRFEYSVLGIILLFPCIVTPMMFVYCRAVFVPIRNSEVWECSFHTPHQAVLFILCCDLVISLSLLSLFCFPLNSLVQKLEQQRTAGSAMKDEFKTIVKENIRISAIMMTSTTTTMAVMAFYGQTPNSNLVGLTFGSFDLVVNSMCLMYLYRRAWVKDGADQLVETSGNKVDGADSKTGKSVDQ